ncbi:hypothetical protein D3C75_933380 [compost metagenome]
MDFDFRTLLGQLVGEDKAGIIVLQHRFDDRPHLTVFDDVNRGNRFFDAAKQAALPLFHQRKLADDFTEFMGVHPPRVFVVGDGQRGKSAREQIGYAACRILVDQACTGINRDRQLLRAEIKGAIPDFKRWCRFPFQRLDPAVETVHRGGRQLRPEHHTFAPVEIQVAVLLLRL